MATMASTQGKQIFFAVILHLLTKVSAYNPFESLFVLLPCFKVIESPTCNSSLPRSFQSQYPTAGLNDPDTKIYLFTPKNPESAEQLHLCGGQLPPDSQFDPSLNTEIFIHGWLDGVCKTGWMREMKEQLFQRGKYNVILVDWSWGNTPDLAAGGINLKVTGEQIGFIINNIKRQTGTGPEKFHVIGHSFGAIAAGYIGRSVTGLRRITALDPALPAFQSVPPNERVTYRDAKIVDVIHTNAANCFVLAFGDRRLLGHADFYPNGGLVEISCYVYLLKSILKGDLLYALASFMPHFCFHLQSIQFYKVSINPKGCEFVGVASESYGSFIKSSPSSNPWAVMGMNYELYHTKSKEIQQKYFLNTKLNCPYYDNSYLGGRQFPFNTSCSRDIL